MIAALLGFPSFFIGIFGFFGVISGAKLVAGSLGAIWGYMAVVGTYELNRRRFDWQRGNKYRDWHLLAGTLAVSTGLMISGALGETMPGLAIVPAISAILQANDGHKIKFLAAVHVLVLGTGIAIAIWFYTSSAIGQVLIQRVTDMP